jgi:predicted AlkP superfamily pyrophosphatase or phosphodiesterase
LKRKETFMLNPAFIKPQYGATCFAHIPATVNYLLTGKQEDNILPDAVFGQLPQRYEAVVLFFIDAFGWRFLERYADDYPFLQEITQNGVVSKLTSQFPSTTAAHVTCIHTGLAPGQSGIFEWQYYEPALDSIIVPLMFSYPGESERETLKAANIDPKTIFPTQTLYQDLNRQGIKSHVFQPISFAYSTFSTQILDGAQTNAYRTFPEALVNLGQLVAQQPRPAYYFLYYPNIDTIGHHYGPNSAQFEAEVDTFLTIMERLFLRKLLRKEGGQRANTLFILTADHGQVEIDPKTTIYLNLDKRFKGIEHYLKTNARGDLLIPGGSARDWFLYIKDGLLDEAQAFLAEGLADKADVVKTQDLIEQGYFGPQPVSRAFLERVGNLVILPYRYESVWWYEKDKFEQKFYGHHGGLTPQEMEIPLLLYTF